MNRLAIVLILVVFIFVGVVAPATAQDARQYYQQSRAAQEAGNLDLALKKIKAGVWAFPHDDGLLDWQSWVEYLLGDYENGLFHAKQATQIVSTSTDHVALIGLNAQGTGDLALAAEAFRYVQSRGVGDPHYSDVHSRLDRLTARDYSVSWEINPSRLSLAGGPALIPYPSSDSSQACTLSVAGALSSSEIEIGGNKALAVMPNGTQHFVLTLDVQIKPYSFREVVAKYDRKAAIPDGVKLYLGESERINPASTSIRQIVAQFPSGQTTIQRVRAIQRWLKKTFTYEFTAGNYKSVDQLLVTKHAECNGYSSTATALLRASGIPARVVWVLTKSPGVAPEGHLKGHLIAEFWLSGPNCWIPFDPQQGDSVGIRFCDMIRMCHQTPDTPWLSSALMQADGDMPAYIEKVHQH